MIALLTLSTGASACGGFFCDRSQPVDQSGEVIVFGVEDGVVTTHVQIAYTGAAEDFAWILPVPGVPDVAVGTPTLFTTLSAATLTTTRLNVTGGGCSIPSDVDSADSDTDADSDADSDPDTDGTVDVLSELPVGPYETVVLEARDPQALIEWLQANGYAVPDSMAGAVAPYLANGMNFLALKLQKDQDVGDLAPLVMKWAGTRASIPITLTSVAATPNMPLTVYVVGEHRAVPLSYLHVQLNPLGYDWFGAGRSPTGRLGVAVDEAGGRAFSTTFAGRNLDIGLWFDQMNTVGLADLVDPLDWFLGLAPRGFVRSPELLDILREHLPAPPGQDENAFYSNPEAYPEAWDDLRATFDPVAATDDLQTRLIDPLIDAQALINDAAWLTRFDTVISPEEMTVDPIFGFNPDLPPVPSLQTATMHRVCGDRGEEIGFMTMPGDFLIDGPPSGTVDLDGWLGRQIGHMALVVEELTESGPGTVLADFTPELLALRPEFDGEDDDADRGFLGCGCATGGQPALWMGAALLFTLRRRLHRQ